MRDATTPTCRRRARGRASLAWLAACAWIGLVAPIVHAQDDIDVEPPLIEHEPIADGVAGDVQEFSATVVDDRELAEVLLFHRFAGDETFDETPMERVASSSVYTASIPTDARDARAIEYYIQARDAAGNRVIKGYAFSPLVRDMADDAAAPQARAGGERESSSGSGRRWLYIGLGVLAVGALAAAAQEEDSESDPNTFTLTLDPPR